MKRTLGLLTMLLLLSSSPALAHFDGPISAHFGRTNFDTNWQYNDPAVFRGKVRIENLGSQDRQVRCRVVGVLETNNWRERERDIVEVFIPGEESVRVRFRIEFDRHVRIGQSFTKRARIPHCHLRPVEI
jgi:hypothetical protein